FIIGNIPAVAFINDAAATGDNTLYLLSCFGACFQSIIVDALFNFKSGTVFSLVFVCRHDIKVINISFSALSKGTKRAKPVVQSNFHDNWVSPASRRWTASLSSSIDAA